MYYGMFDNQDDVLRQFQLSEEDLKGCKILFAAYGCDYEGQALVVFRRNRKLYEVNGSHCSCYGLEDQWEPEETSVQALWHRVQKGTLGFYLGEFTAPFVQMLERQSRKRLAKLT